ncbi:unnamed protein product [Peniophora sp. CBMAI 1063]|nr:unnamed protein product [Peniophora sp. CBMAI 1063]
MPEKLGPHRSWGGDDKEGSSRRQSNAHKLSTINYPGLYAVTQPNAPITSPTARSSTRATPGPSRAQYPNPSASMPPRAVSAPASFSPQVGGSQPLPPTSQHPPMATLATHVAPAAPQHHPQAPHHQAQLPQGIPNPPHSEMHKAGKWCWVDLSRGWVWAWVPNVPPPPAVLVPANALRWSRKPQMRPWGSTGNIIVTTSPVGDWRQCAVMALAVDSRWYWVHAWVPNVPPGPPPDTFSVYEWARHGPPLTS